MPYLNKINDIEYQLLKNLTFTPSDEQYVKITQSILKSILKAAENGGEDLYSAVQAGTLPATFLGVNVTWDQSNPEGDSFTLERNGITLYQDADDPLSDINVTSPPVDPSEILNDFDANLAMLPDYDPLIKTLTLEDTGETMIPLPKFHTPTGTEINWTGTNVFSAQDIFGGWTPTNTYPNFTEVTGPEGAQVLLNDDTTVGTTLSFTMNFTVNFVDYNRTYYITYQ